MRKRNIIKKLRKKKWWLNNDGGNIIRRKDIEMKRIRKLEGRKIEGMGEEEKNVGRENEKRN